jgi:hypothetical protein
LSFRNLQETQFSIISNPYGVFIIMTTTLLSPCIFAGSLSRRLGGATPGPDRTTNRQLDIFRLRQECGGDSPRPAGRFQVPDQFPPGTAIAFLAPRHAAREEIKRIDAGVVRWSRSDFRALRLHRQWQRSIIILRVATRPASDRNTSNESAKGEGSDSVVRLPLRVTV